jgi:hypothetical protein
MEVSVQLHGPAALFARERSRQPLGRRLGWPQSWFGHCAVLNITKVSSNKIRINKITFLSAKHKTHKMEENRRYR